MQIEFRRAAPSDMRPLYAVEKDAFGDSAWPQDVFESAVLDPRNEFTMALRDGRPVGYILINHSRPEVVKVDSLAVAKDTQGQKLGEQLLLRSLEDGQRQGCTSAALEVEKGNLPAEKLYAKYGFVPTRILSQYYGPGRDGSEMQLADLQAAPLAERRKDLELKLGGFPSKTYTG